MENAPAPLWPGRISRSGMSDCFPPLLEAEAVVPVALATGINRRYDPTVGKKSPAIDHDTFIHIRRARSVTGLAPDPFLISETGGEPGIDILSTSSMASQAPLIFDRLDEVLVFLTLGSKVPCPVGGEPPVGRGVTAAEPGDVLVTVFLSGVAGSAPT